MAQTKNKPKQSRPSKSKTTSKAKSRKPSKAAKPKSRNGSSANGAGGATAARDAVKNAGKGVGQVTSKAKVPLLAGGAALIGAAGGAALSAGKSGRKVMGVRMPQTKRVKIRSKDLRKAAKEVSSFGEHVGELTSELQRIRKGVSKA